MNSTGSKAVFFIAIFALVAFAATWIGASTTGIISGVVKNADDSSPMAGANIIITGTSMTAVTDSKGYFAITNVPPGDYEVRAEMVGFAPQSLGAVQVSMDTTTAANFDMKKQATQEIAASVTRAKPPRPMINADVPATLNLVTASQEPQTRTDPTGFHAVNNLVSTLPGTVADPGGAAASVHFRGGRSDGIGYYVEGIPITDPNSGMFSTNLFSTGVSKFQMYSGGFGAEFGNAVSGVLNEVKKTGSQDNGLGLQMEGGGQAYSSAFLQMGEGSTDRFNYYIGSILQRDNFEGSPTYTSQAYSDNTVKMVWPDKNNKYTLLALQGSYTAYADYYHDVGDNDAPTPHEKDYQLQRYTVDAFTWSHSFSSGSFLTVQPYYIWDSTVQNLSGTYTSMYGTPITAYYDAWSSQRGLQLEYTDQINKQHLLKAGGSVLSSINRFHVTDYYDSRTDTFQTALFVEDNMKLANKWALQAGLRDEGIKYLRGGATYDAVNQTYTGPVAGNATDSAIDPRLGLSYAPDSRTALKFNWGKYCKFVPAYEAQKMYTDPTSETGTAGIGSTVPEKSTQYEVSFEKQFSSSASYRITPFWADYNSLLQAYQDNTGVTQYTNLGKGTSKGVEMLLRKRMSNNWEGWLSYTYMTTKANSSAANDPLSSPTSGQYYASWDQRHTISLVTSYKARNLTHNLRFDFGSGRADVISPGVTGQGRANPNVVLSYDLSLALPKGSSLGKSLDLSIYNLLDSRQVLQYQNDGTTRTVNGWVPSRSISLGLNKVF